MMAYGIGGRRPTPLLSLSSLSPEARTPPLPAPAPVSVSSKVPLYALSRLDRGSVNLTETIIGLGRDALESVAPMTKPPSPFRPPPP